jgi:hypothetical protein
MRERILAPGFGLLFGLLLHLASGIAVASEPPSIRVQANAPGWITVNYYHSGTGDVSSYRIERQGGASVEMYSPNGQWTDSNLAPSTAYTYRACAVYEEGDPVCSPWITERTLPTPGRPASLDPPGINNVRVDTASIHIEWGPIGDYTRVRVSIRDNGGFRNEVEHRSAAFAYGTQTFTGLQAGTDYYIALRACSYSLLGETCGSPSAERVIRTAEPPPPPPGRPTLKMTRSSITGATTALSLEFSVVVSRANASDRFILYRNDAVLKEIAPSPAPRGWAGAFTDTVPSDQRHQQLYHVCFQGYSPPARVCSDGVVRLVQVEPTPVDTVKPGPSRSAKAAKELFGGQAGPPPAAAPAPHPATCKPGYVWRVARPDDLVCVTPASRSRVAAENRTAAERVQPGGGAYGPNTCRVGFVWREAFNGDGVCVTPDIRSLVREENRLAPSRRIQP